MLSSALFAVAAILGASAMPTAKRNNDSAASNMTMSGPTDTQILQYALTLENLEKTL
jgi:hypothetical protein